MFRKKLVRSTFGVGLTVTLMLAGVARAQIIPGADVSEDAALFDTERASGWPEADAGVPRGWLESAPVHASLEHLLEQAQYGLTPYEAAAWIVRDGGGVALREWNFTRAYEKASWSGPPPAGALAIVHTHPIHADPRPSSGDAALARRLGLPVYTLTRNGLWEARPDGTIRLEAPAPESCTRLACVPSRDAGSAEPLALIAAETNAAHPAL